MTVCAQRPKFLHRRHPQPAELAEQQGLNDQFEAWAKTKRLNLSCYMDMAIGYCDERTKTAWAAWQAALAVTGKQQVGEVPTGDIRFDGRPRYPEQSAIGKLYTVADAIQPSAAQHEQVRRRLILEAVDMLIAAVPEQVSEVQGSND